MINRHADVTFGAWVGKRSLHNERAVFRQPYDRSFRSEDKSLIEYMAVLTPKQCGRPYTVARLDLSQFSERQLVMMIMDDVALDAVRSGESVKTIHRHRIGETAITTHMYTACQISTDRLRSANAAEGGRLGETLLEISIDRLGGVRVQDVSPHGTEIYANWELAFDDEAVTAGVLRASSEHFLKVQA